MNLSKIKKNTTVVAFNLIKKNSVFTDCKLNYRFVSCV